MLQQLLSDIKLISGDSDQNLLFFDYDGTLSPIVADPKKAFLDEQIKQALIELSNKPHTEVIIVTGRSYAAISGFIGIDKLLYITNHGNMTIQNGKIIEKTDHFKQIKELRNAYENLLTEIQNIDKSVYLEEKEVSTAFHYRNVSSIEHEQIEEQIITLINKHLGAHQVKIKTGKKVIEIFPTASDQNKGTAIARTFEQLRQNEKSVFSFFIGDDVTDEDGFEVLNHFSQITIKVGEGKTQAKYRLDDPNQVKEFILELVSIL
jgi:trehalose 6-phosphate phosphatase